MLSHIRDGNIVVGVDDAWCKDDGEITVNENVNNVTHKLKKKIVK